MGQGVQAAQHHHMADLAKPVLMCQEHQQLLGGIESAAGQAQPDLTGECRQVRDDRMFVGAGADAQGGRTAHQQIDPLRSVVLGHREAPVAAMAVAHAQAVGVDGAGAIAALMHVQRVGRAAAAQQQEALVVLLQGKRAALDVRGMVDRSHGRSFWHARVGNDAAQPASSLML